MRTRSLRMRSPRLFVAAALASTLLLGQEKLADGPGKETVQKACASCHEIEAVISSHRTRIGWQLSVDDMISTLHFGKVNVNTASVQELEKTLNIPAKEAQAIQGYREKSGRIKDFEELRKINGVSAEALGTKHGLIAFSQ